MHCVPTNNRCTILLSRVLVSGPDISPQAQRALAIIEDLSSYGQSFVRRWMGFNAFYNHFEANSERDRLMAAITQGMSDKQAESVFANCQSATKYLAALPLGDMRRDSSHAAFRKRAVADMRAAHDDRLSSRKTLAHLVATVYQVRCNLFHSHKDPRLKRDSELIAAGDSIMRAVMDHLLVNARAA